MKRASWLCWLLASFMIYLSDAQYKLRRSQLPSPPLPPRPPPQILKKSWAPRSRISSMGNSILIGGNFAHKRPLYNPSNYRFRRPPGPPQPPPMFNVLPSLYKNPIPSILGSIKSYGDMIQHISPIKELQSIPKVPQQYSLEYQPEIENLPTHRGSIDDDKGPIHTIPAPNLGPASKSYQQQQQLQQQQQKMPSNNQDTKREETVRRPYSVTQIDYTNVFGGEESSIIPQRISPSNSISTNNIQHKYEVTESNELNSLPPTYFTPDFDASQYSSSNIQEQKKSHNDIYLNHPPSLSSSLTDSRTSGIEPSVSMQANLYSSMHVGTSGPRTEIGHQAETSDLHVGHPSPGGPPVSAAKLYELLNALPHQLADHYALDQQPQMQQHLLQQQLSQILQQQNEQIGSVKAKFSQPTLHSFNYDEQANKQKQQQQQNIFIDQNYASGKVIEDYSLASEGLEINGGDTNEQRENNIEFENSMSQVKPTSYYNKIEDEQNMATQFYTTLPNRETAEKLAALAAAGNVNSQLIDQLRKQQQQQHESQQLHGQQSSLDQSIPANHKVEHRNSNVDSGINQRVEEYNEHQTQDKDQQLIHRRQKIKEEQIQTEEDKEKHEQQNSEEEKQPLKIFVPEKNTEKEKEIIADDYEYENDEIRVPRTNESFSEDLGFGSRIVSKIRK